MLLIDIGNTRLKWSVSESVSDGLVCHAMAYMQEDLLACLQHAFADIESQDVWISCVAGDEVREQLRSWFLKNWNLAPAFAQTQTTSMGLTNAYQEMSALGVDRWLAMLAAWQLYQQAVCVIDAGTAVTMDVVDGEGGHQGGLILPGLQLLQQSLQLKTSAIEQSAVTDMLLAKDTASAVGSGCRLMMRKSVGSIFKEFEDQLHLKLLCVLTGGDGELLKSEFKHYEYREDLVLCGLYLMACQNT